MYITWCACDQCQILSFSVGFSTIHSHFCGVLVTCWRMPHVIVSVTAGACAHSGHLFADAGLCILC